MTYSNSTVNWWSSRRLRYNKGLFIAGVLAFLLYAILGGILIEPYDTNFEVTLFTTLFQGVAYLMMMVVANCFYSLGYLIDKWFNKADSNGFRLRLFNLGFWFSIALPFLIPIIVVIQYFTIYRK